MKTAKPLKTVHKAHWPVRKIMLKILLCLIYLIVPCFIDCLIISVGSNPGFIFPPTNYFPLLLCTNLRTFITRSMYQGFKRTSLGWKQTELDLGLCQELLESINPGLEEAGNKTPI